MNKDKNIYKFTFALWTEMDFSSKNQNGKKGDKIKGIFCAEKIPNPPE